MNLKRIVVGFLGLFDPMQLIPVLIDFMEQVALLTPTLVDDAAIAALRAAAMNIWPDLFD
jgi:hypothetical protein